MKKRWICLFVENDIGVLARIAGLFSAKAYNLDSLTVGRTEDETVSRMTISLTSDDKTFEQVKKQLNRCIEVIKVVDYTGCAVCRKEMMYAKIPVPKKTTSTTQINLTIVESIPKYSAIPPQTPQSFLSTSDLYNFFIIITLR